jgi:hypothetical protein
MANVKVGLGLDRHQPEAVENGVNVAVCRISLSATTSAGDKLLIGKLPNGAIPLDCVFYRGAAIPDNTIWKFGFSASDAAFLASRSYSAAEAAVRANVSLANVQISLSDDARVMFEYIVAVPAAVITAGHYGTLIVQYKMPGQTT